MTANRELAFMVLLSALLMVAGASHADGEAQSLEPFVKIGRILLEEGFETRVTPAGELALGEKVKSKHRLFDVGSGSIVTTDGLVITNDHVFMAYLEEQPEDLVGERLILRHRPISRDMIVSIVDPTRLGLAPRRLYLARLLARDRQRDVAVLEITRDLSSDRSTGSTLFDAVEFGNPYALKIGDPLTIYGYPGKGGPTLTRTGGTFSGFRADGRIKTDAGAAPGNSGGAAVNEGNQVGIVTAVTIPEAVGGDITFVHPITWAVPALSWAHIKLGRAVPAVGLDWVEDPRNRDFSNHSAYFGGFVKTLNGGEPVSGAYVFFYREDLSWEDVIQIDNEYLANKKILKVHQLHHGEGYTIEYIAKTEKLRPEIVQAYLEIDISSIPDDVKALLRCNLYRDCSRFVYRFDKTDSDGFFHLALPRDARVRVSVRSEGYRNLQGSVDIGRWVWGRLSAPILIQRR
jgi:hypothetical protein